MIAIKSFVGPTFCCFLSIFSPVFLAFTTYTNLGLIGLPFFVTLVILRTTTVLLMVALANFVGLAAGLILGLTSKIAGSALCPAFNKRTKIKLFYFHIPIIYSFY